jgi:hypothetical protein
VNPSESPNSCPDVCPECGDGQYGGWRYLTDAEGYVIVGEAHCWSGYHDKARDPYRCGYPGDE